MVTGISCAHACILTIIKLHSGCLALSSSIGSLFHVKTYAWYALVGGFLGILQFYDVTCRDGGYKLRRSAYRFRKIAALCHQIE